MRIPSAHLLSNAKLFIYPQPQDQNFFWQGLGRVELGVVRRGNPKNNKLAGRLRTGRMGIKYMDGRGPVLALPRALPAQANLSSFAILPGT